MLVGDSCQSRHHIVPRSAYLLHTIMLFSSGPENKLDQLIMRIKFFEQVDIKTVQYLAGHEKSKTTLDIYAHLAYNKPEDTITKVRKAFGQPSAQESV